MPSFNHEVFREELPLYRNGSVTGALVDIQADLSVDYDGDDFSYSIDAIRVRAYGGAKEYATVSQLSDLGDLILKSLKHKDENLDDEVSEAISEQHSWRHEEAERDAADRAWDLRHEAA